MSQPEGSFLRSFRLASLLARGVVLRRGPGLLAGAAGVMLILYLGMLLPGGTGGVFWLLYFVSLAGLLAWCLRACLEVLYPDAEGGRVGLGRYLWRMGLAWALTALPALIVSMFVAALGELESNWVILQALLTILIAAIGTAMWVVSSAKVAMTGDWRPTAAWRALQGGRFGALKAVVCVVLGAGIAVPILLLPVLMLPEGSAVAWGLGFPLGALAHAGVGLALAAIGLGAVAALERVQPA